MVELFRWLSRVSETEGRKSGKREGERWVSAYLFTFFNLKIINKN